MIEAELYRSLVEAALNQELVGWDFSYVDGRLIEAPTPWSYRDCVSAAIPAADSLLDIGTGGGEFLTSFEHLPSRTFATEEYEPNIKIAQQRLAARGIGLAGSLNGLITGLPDHCIYLFINRHGAYKVEELLRLASPDGARFVTQQVGSDNARGINNALDENSPPSGNWTLQTAVEELTRHGCTITQALEAFPTMSFHDIGAVVFYLKAIPWQIPLFDVQTMRDNLMRIHRQIQTQGVFTVNAHRFLIEARIN